MEGRKGHEPLKTGKGRKMILPYSLQEGVSHADALVFTLVRTIWYFWPSEMEYNTLVLF